MQLLTAIFGILNSIIGRATRRAENQEVKKEAEGRRDESLRNDNERVVEEASKTGNLEELRKRAGE